MRALVSSEGVTRSRPDKSANCASDHVNGEQKMGFLCGLDEVNPLASQWMSHSACLYVCPRGHCPHHNPQPLFMPRTIRTTKRSADGNAPGIRAVNHEVISSPGPACFFQPAFECARARRDADKKEGDCLYSAKNPQATGLSAALAPIA